MTVSIDLSGLAALVVCSGLLGAVALKAVSVIAIRRRAKRDAAQSGEAFQSFLRSEEFSKRMDAVQPGQFDPAPFHAANDTLLRARIDHLREVGQIWGPEVRKSAVRQVAEVMRRSVRRGDAQSGLGADVIREIPGEGFTILIKGAAEEDGGRIAKRLRRDLARARIDGLADNLRLTASFGVAGRKLGESLAAWRARAENAVNVASAAGDDQIVEASIADEIKLLPPPAVEATETVSKAA